MTPRDAAAAAIDLAIEETKAAAESERVKLDAALDLGTVEHYAGRHTALLGLARSLLAQKARLVEKATAT